LNGSVNRNGSVDSNGSVAAVPAHTVYFGCVRALLVCTFTAGAWVHCRYAFHCWCAGSLSVRTSPLVRGLTVGAHFTAGAHARFQYPRFTICAHLTMDAHAGWVRTPARYARRLGTHAGDTGSDGPVKRSASRLARMTDPCQPTRGGELAAAFSISSHSRLQMPTCRPSMDRVV
jgi:hypothetical protein